VATEEIDTEHAGASRSRRRRIWWIAGAVGLIVAATLAIVLPLALTSGPPLRGMVTFFSPSGSVYGSWDECRGAGSLNELKPGGPVRVRDGSATVVGLGQLRNVDAEVVRTEVQSLIQRHAPGWEEIGPGDLDVEVQNRIDYLDAGAGFGSCTLYFEIPAPRSEYLAVEVGDRQIAEFNLDELRSQGWWIWVDAPLSWEEMTGLQVD